MSAAPVRTLDGGTATLGEAEIRRFARRLSGELLLPGTDGYEGARRIWNGMIDKRPGLILRCRSAADVAAGVDLAREHGLALAVRAGGHNVAGNALSDGGLVLDLREMDGVEVDPDRSAVRIGAGATLGQVDRAAYPFGLATPMGVVTATGYAGLTLHGGAGWQLRRRGLAADNVSSFELVGADGELRRADPEENPDLFWALRGGGGNFGVVTSFTSRLHPIPREVTLAVPLFSLEEAPAVLGFLRDHMPAAPEELMVIAVLWTAPEEPRVPAQWQGQPVLFVLGCYTGEEDRAREAIEPLRSCRPVVADLTGRLSWLDAQRFFDADYPDGRRYYWKSTMVSGLTDPLIGAMVEQARQRPSLLSSIDIWALGGAFGRVGADDTAFGEREAPFMVNYESNWEDPGEDPANIRWTRECLAATQALAGGGRTYLNFAGFGEEGEGLVRGSFGRNYERLRQVKARHDPENLFRSNFNIAPAARPGRAAPVSARAQGSPSRKRSRSLRKLSEQM